MIDKEKNYLPENVKNIHVISACGTAMGALCVMLKQSGYRVTGSDSGVYPPMSTFLGENGISLFEGYAESNIPEDTDLVIIGNAVSKNNDEVLGVVKRGLPYLSMPQAINLFFARSKKIIMVTGTHGKTTTTGLISWILEYCGADPSFFIGGIHKNFGAGFKLGNGDYFVIEGDEYDTAFFDKESKFLHYSPHRLVITNIEFDHADIFSSIDDIKSAFHKLLCKVDKDATVFGYDGSKELVSVLKSFDSLNLKSYGFLSGEGKNKDILCSDLEFYTGRTGFNLKSEWFDGEISVPLTGTHNVLNTAAAVSVALSLGFDQVKIIEALNEYQGMKRRQDIRGTANGVIVMDDFAHHPTEVKFTVEGVKKSYNPDRLIAVFEPGTNTSMRNIFQDEYEDVFHGADIVCMKRPARISKVEEGKRISIEKLVDAVNNKGIKAKAFENTDLIIDYLVSLARPGDLILVMSNGGFDNIHERLLKAL